ncbi:hypothetical protein Hamer_G026980 [Homarus americanus]|uniref:Uncharacterized protein n=1 Tax=Homarus americanus TaxID=6706 RepID=A0A8J5K795_HOMAM|nr:hypothetical protein Hamer_G026980 [Homarus americanus]
MIILQQLGQFAQQRSILEIFGWNDHGFPPCPLLPDSSEVKLASVSRFPLCEAQQLPQWTIPYCALPPTPQHHHHPLPGPWNCKRHNFMNSSLFF